MENIGTVINVLKNFKNDYNTIVKFCNTSRRIKKICIEYGKSIFGMEYNDIIYALALNKRFPTLHYHFSLEQLLKYYGSFPEIWRVANLKKNTGEIQMCRNFHHDFVDDDFDVINPHDPRNLIYIAPYHRAILYPHKKITFLFFSSFR